MERSVHRGQNKPKPMMYKLQPVRIWLARLSAWPRVNPLIHDLGSFTLSR
jgi:hypothetical protein